MSKDIPTDGIRSMVLREEMAPHIRKYRDAYDVVPGAPFYRKEFGFFGMENWKQAGSLPADADLQELFMFDPPGDHKLGQLGWCEAAVSPCFEDRVIEDRGEHEVVQDFAGRHVLVFKGRRSGFMPEYLDHPVKDMKTWEEDFKWRLDPDTKERHEGLDERMAKARECAGQGMIICQNLVGGYMYLRSMIGPEDLLYKFYDEPELIHECMKAWLRLSDAVISRHQEHVTIDEVYLAEDICYNVGPLISPDMMREFLTPYYQQLITNLRSRQIDADRKLFVSVDTDGHAESAIPVYQEEIGLNSMNPFEVASGCDVVEIGKQYPELVMGGGIDKRILAKTKDDIDREVERIFPVMRERGGYIPTCDHGVPEEVSYENYVHYRERCIELGG